MIAHWSGTVSVSASVTANRTRDVIPVRQARRASGIRPITSSTPMTNSRPPMTASGIWPTNVPNTTTRTTTVAAAT